MAAGTGIGRRLLIGCLDTGLDDRNRPSWLLTTSSERWLRRSWRTGGRHVRYRSGSSRHTLTARECE